MQLAACTAIVSMTNTANPYHKEKISFGDRLNDIQIKQAINISIKQQGLTASTNLYVYNGYVIITGATTSIITSTAIKSIALNTKGVRAVYNHLPIGKKLTVYQQVKGIWLGIKLKLALIANNHINNSRIVFYIYNSQVYFMGIVTDAEAQAVIKTAKSIHGITDIVTAFEYKKS